MWHLLKIEWMKVRKYRAFLLLVGFFVISIFGLNYIVFALTEAGAIGGGSGAEEAPAMPDMATILLGRPFSFPAVWQTVTYLSSFLLFIPGLLVILLMANEFSYRTHRQNIIDGLSRSQFLWAKIAVMGVLAVGVTLLVFLAGCYFGSQSGGTFSLENIRYVSFFFIQSIAYMTAALVIVMLFRRSGISIGLYFLYAFIIENVVVSIINRYIMAGAGGYLPLKSADKLIPAPSIIGTLMDSGPHHPTWYIIVSVLWIGVLLWFCHYRLRSMDL